MSNAELRRPGVLGVHSLDHFVLNVPDLAVAKSFYEDFGLVVKEENGGLGLYTDGHSHCWARIAQADKKALSKLCFACFEDDYPRFKDHLASQGVSFEEVDGALEFTDPAGMALNISVAERSSGEAPGPFEPKGGAVGARAATLRSDGEQARPNRLSHLAMFTTDFETTLSFYQDVLGLRLSDRSLDIVAFMHGVHGSDHHMVALLNSTGPGMHHCSWEVSSINEIGIGATAMAMKGHDYQWGLGRHVLGSNYFNYIRDPWGSYIEYSAGMDYVPADCDYDSADYGPEDSFYLWGPDVPEGFTDNLEQA